MSNIPLEQGDFERQVEFDFLRATESAALNTLQWLGKGQKEKADEAACDAIRGTLDLVDICGEVVIGEGIKDNAPGLFKGGKDRQLERWIAAIRDRVRASSSMPWTYSQKPSEDRIKNAGSESPRTGRFVFCGPR